MAIRRFTPGPWKVDGDDIIERTGCLGGVYIAQEGNGRVAQTFANCLVTTDEECRANARLIAASPRMYDLLFEAIAGGDRPRDYLAWLKDVRGLLEDEIDVDREVKAAP